jgi:hypothetical protein
MSLYFNTNKTERKTTDLEKHHSYLMPGMMFRDFFKRFGKTKKSRIGRNWVKDDDSTDNNEK